MFCTLTAANLPLPCPVFVHISIILFWASYLLCIFHFCLFFLPLDLIFYIFSRPFNYYIFNLLVIILEFSTLTV